MNRQTRAALLAAAAASLATIGCGGPVLDEGRYVDDPTLRAQLVQRAASVYPDSFRMVQRVLLTVAGREFDLTGYCLIKRPSMLRAVGMSELGGTVFDVVSRDPRHVEAAKGLPGRLGRMLQAGVAETVRELFLEVPSEASYVVTFDDGDVGLLEFSRDGPVSVLLFDAETGLPLRRMTAERGRVVREVAYSDWGVPPGGEGELPMRLSVSDNRIGYRVEVDLISMSVLDLPDSYFELDGATDAGIGR